MSLLTYILSYQFFQAIKTFYDYRVPGTTRRFVLLNNACAVFIPSAGQYTRTDLINQYQRVITITDKLLPLSRLGDRASAGSQWPTGELGKPVAFAGGKRLLLVLLTLHDPNLIFDRHLQKRPLMTHISYHHMNGWFSPNFSDSQKTALLCQDRSGRVGSRCPLSSSWNEIFLDGAFWLTVISFTAKCPTKRLHRDTFVSAYRWIAAHTFTKISEQRFNIHNMSTFHFPKSPDITITVKYTCLAYDFLIWFLSAQVSSDRTITILHERSPTIDTRQHTPSKRTFVFPGK